MRRLPRAFLRPSWVVFGLGTLCWGCGATGLSWVSEPENPEPMSEPLAAGATARSERLVSTDARPAEIAESRPRLSHSVTLGQTYANPVEPARAGKGEAAPSIVVNNYTNVNTGAPGYGYVVGYAPGGYGFGSSGNYGAAPALGPARASSAGTQPGQNWPAIADHGSSFPYRSAPASPWERAR